MNKKTQMLFRPVQGQRPQSVSVAQTLQQQAQQQAAQTPPADESKPPWGDEEANFDAARAWTLIQNLRTEKATLKTQLDTAVADKDAEITRLTGELTDAQSSLTDATTKVTTLEGQLGEKDGTIATKDAVITKHQLLSAAGLDLDYADQVVGDDDTAWKASVTKLQKLAGSSGTSVPDPVQVAAGQGQQAPASDDAEAKAFFGV